MKGLRLVIVGLALCAAPIATSPLSQAQVTGPDIQRADSAIMNAGKRAAQVRALKQVPSVGVIRLDVNPEISRWSDAPAPAEYRIMARKYVGGVSKLQQALRSNPVTRDALAKRGINPGQVAGAMISSNGSLRLYIFSR